MCLEAFAVHDGGAGLVVLLLADPHLLEGGEGSQDGAADPDRVLALRWGDNLEGINTNTNTSELRFTFYLYSRRQSESVCPCVCVQALTLIFMVEGARDVISFCMRSAMPGYMVVPPDRTVLAYRSLRMSTSHFMMELKVVSWIPQDSIPGGGERDGYFRGGRVQMV